LLDVTARLRCERIATEVSEMTFSIETVTLLERTLWATVALTPILIGLYKGAVEYGARPRRRTLVMTGRSTVARRSAAAA
jgi:hypothetical protein